MDNNEPDFSPLEQLTRPPSELDRKPIPYDGDFDWMNTSNLNVDMRDRDKSRGGRGREEGEYAIRKRRRVKKFSIKRWVDDPKKKYVVIYVFQFILAFLAAIFTILVLYTINPPLTQDANGKQSYQAVLIFAAVIFVVVFALPEFFRWIKY